MSLIDAWLGWFACTTAQTPTEFNAQSTMPNIPKGHVNNSVQAIKTGSATSHACRMTNSLHNLSNKTPQIFNEKMKQVLVFWRGIDIR